MKLGTASRALVAAAFAAALLVTGTANAKSRRTVKRSAPTRAAVVNINTASGAQLQLLPGIGPSKARAIEAYRARRKFRSTRQIVRVRGIGPKTFRKLKPHLTVIGPTTMTGKPVRRPSREG